MDEAMRDLGKASLRSFYLMILLGYLQLEVTGVKRVC